MCIDGMDTFVYVSGFVSVNRNFQRAERVTNSSDY